MTANGDHRGDEPLAGASRSFEEHEHQLLEELYERIWRDIPPGATVGEACAEMERAVLRDDDARELLMRVQALARVNDGYLRSHFLRANAPPKATETRYRFALAGTPQAKEAIQPDETPRRGI